MSPATSDLPIEGSPPSDFSHDTIDEKAPDVVLTAQDEPKAGATIFTSGDLGGESDHSGDEVIIRTGADAATHLLSMRDDGDNALTFRSIILATIFACFQSVMYQIYEVSLLVWVSASFRCCTVY